MPSKDFIITIRDAKGKETKARTSIVNFDSEDPEEAKAEWHKHNGHVGEIVDIEFAGDTSAQGFAKIQQTIDKVNQRTAGNMPVVSSPPTTPPTPNVQP